MNMQNAKKSLPKKKKERMKEKQSERSKKQI